MYNKGNDVLFTLTDFKEINSNNINLILRGRRHKNIYKADSIDVL